MEFGVCSNCKFHPTENKENNLTKLEENRKSLSPSEISIFGKTESSLNEEVYSKLCKLTEDKVDETFLLSIVENYHKRDVQRNVHETRTCSNISQSLKSTIFPWLRNK